MDLGAMKMDNVLRHRQDIHEMHANGPALLTFHGEMWKSQFFHQFSIIHFEEISKLFEEMRLKQGGKEEGIVPAYKYLYCFTSILLLYVYLLKSHFIVSFFF